MKISKNILNCLLTFLLINTSTTKSLASFDTNRYELFNDSNILINDNTQSKPVEVKIEGNTLISPMRNPAFANRSKINPIRLKQGRVINDSTTKTSQDNNYYILNSETNEFLTLKEDTTYTIFISGRVYFSDSTISPYIVPFYKSLDNGSFITKQIKHISTSNNSYFNDSVVFTTDSNIIESFGFYVTPSRTRLDNIDVYFHIVEGDVQNQLIPYFEGIKSIGQNESLENEIIIKSQNKNISTELEYGRYNEYGEKAEDFDTGVVRSKDFIRVNPGDKLIYSNANIERALNIYYYDANKTFMYKRGGTSSEITIPDNCYYIKYHHYSTDSESLQLEYGDTITSYVERLSNEKIIKLKEPLRKINNEIKDRIIKRNGQWVVERKLKEITLDGTEEYELFKSGVGTTGFTISSIDTVPANRYSDEVICDIIPSGNHNDFTSSDILDWDSEYFRISNRNTNLKGLYVVMPTSIASTVEDIKNWMSKNKPKVIYIQPEITYEVINDSILDLYLENMHISNNSDIPANMSILIDRVINIAKEKVEVVKKNPTVENISQTRYWINLIDESILKDQLQENLNSIFSISDLKIDKKTVSANMDIYIKSQNSLSMTLSTNYIIFDEFSGIKDMEKLNAVEISVDSSLPYQLNSYLESEIKNSDGTKIIPKELLNIRLNGENDYKAFSNINEKLILKENCEKGNSVFGIDLILKGTQIHEADIYKTIIRFEVEQK